MTTLFLRVAASADDAFEDWVGTMYTGASTPTLSSESGWLGWRFRNVLAPSGSVADYGALEIYVHSSDDDVHMDMWCEDADDAAAFTATGYDISGRARSASHVDWDTEDGGIGWLTSPDLAAPIGETLARAGYGQDGLVIIGDGQPYVRVEPRMYDYAAADAAILTLDYRAPAVAGGAMPVVMANYRRRRT